MVNRLLTQARLLGMGLDTGSAAVRMMLTIVGAIAQFEREMMPERQREGIARQHQSSRDYAPTGWPSTGWPPATARRPEQGSQDQFGGGPAGSCASGAYNPGRR